MNGEQARELARAMEHYIHGLCPGGPIANDQAATCAHCNMSRVTLEELVWHKLRPGEPRRMSAESVGLEPPFALYENYDGGYEVIDALTRSVLSDSFAYDANDAARLERMEWIVARLSLP